MDLLQQYQEVFKTAENFAEQNDWFAVKNTLSDWFFALQNNSQLIDENALLLLLKAIAKISDNEGIETLNNNISICEKIVDLKIKDINELALQTLNDLYKTKQVNKAFDNDLKILLNNCRNDKNFKDQAENNTEVKRKKFPFISRSKNEICERPKILLQPIGGRSGSIFLHSLIDNHTQISTLPLFITHAFFANGVWELLKPDFNDNEWQIKLIANFCKTYRILFGCDDNAKIPFWSDSYTSEQNRQYLSIGLGLIPPSPRKNGYFGVNLDVFINYLICQLHNKKSISRAAFFDLLHAAYQASLNRPINTKLDFYHIHLANSQTIANCVYSYKNIRLLTIIRNPMQSIESFIKCYTSWKYDYTNNAKLNYTGSIFCIIQSLFGSFSHFNKVIPSKVIRLEDIKKNTDNTLHKLCEWFGVNYSETLKEETFGNNKFNAASQQNIKGFNTENIDRKIGSLYIDKHQNLSERDYRILNILSYPLSVKYNYQKADSDFIKSEIKYLKNELSKNENYLFDYEINLQQQVKNKGISESEIYTIHKNFRANLLPFLDYLEKYQTYPGLAELLEV